MSARFIVGDVRDVLATLPDSSVDLVFTSPPFLALRSYLPAGHPDKAREIGSEPDPGAFIDTLLGVTEDLARVLAPHGSLCIELGDTYAGSGGAGGDYYQGGWRDGQQPFEGSMKHARIHDPEIGPPIQNKDGKRQGGGPGWPLAKSACLIPELYRLSLAYGHNPLTGRETPRWRVRNTIRWCRPNPPVGALGDKFRPATSEIVVACKAKDRYFDLDAVRQPVSEWTERYAASPMPLSTRAATSNHQGDATRRSTAGETLNAQGAPPLDWWKIPTHGYPGAHYATFPPALVTIPLLAMCPERVCIVCGLPSRRIVHNEHEGHGANAWNRHGTAAAVFHRDVERPHYSDKTTLGWSDCGHDSYRRGLVLDPFGGSGTVAEVATGHGRDAILIDIDERNAELARTRVGMFLTVEEPSGRCEVEA